MIINPVLTKGLVMREHIIYESIQECTEAGVNVVSLYDSDRGDYVPSIQGFYVPCLRKSDYAKHDGSEHRLRYFPAKKVYLDPDGSTFLSYDAEDRVDWFTKIQLWQQEWCHGVAAGLHPVEALSRLFKSRNGKYYHYQTIIANLVADKKVMYYLWHYTDMASLRQELIDRNIGLHTVADNIKEIVTNPKAPSNLKVWALNQITTAMEERRPMFAPPKDPNMLPEQNGDVDRLSPVEEYKMKLLQSKEGVTDGSIE